MTAQELYNNGYKQLTCMGKNALEIILESVSNAHKNGAKDFVIADDMELYKHTSQISVPLNIKDGELISWYK
jgi:hypothetical protein